MSASTPLRSLALCLIVLLATACSYTSVRQHKDFHEVAAAIDSVLIAPPSVTAELVVFTGENERDREKEARLATGLTRIAWQKMQEHGLQVVDFDIEQAIAEDEEFAYALTQCREAYEKAREDLYDGRQVLEADKDKFQASLGSVVNIIAERTGAESLLLMEYYGFEKSEGMVAKDMATTVLLGLLTGAVVVQPTKGAVLNVALIDTASGDVLWANSKANPALDTRVAELALQELPTTTWGGRLAVADAGDAEETVGSAAELMPETSLVAEGETTVEMPMDEPIGD